MTWIAARCLCGILALLMVCAGGGWAQTISGATVSGCTLWGAAAGSCDSSAEDARSQKTSSSQTTSTLRGQSFQIATTGYIHSIMLYMYANDPASDDLTLCLDDSANMGSSGACSNAIVCETQTVNFSTGANNITFTFQDTTHQFSSGTTYYMALRSADAIAGGWYYATGNPYSYGQKYSTTATDCDLTGHEDSSEDFAFVVYLCD